MAPVQFQAPLQRLCVTVIVAEDGFVVTTKGGKVFDDVDLSDDWNEWDEKLNESVGIYGIEAKFQLHKGK